MAVPRVPPGSTSSWAQYTIRTDRRDELQHGLAERGIRTEIYYPRPLHMQPPYRALPAAPGGLPVTERLKDEVLSLPMHPYLTRRPVRLHLRRREGHPRLRCRRIDTAAGARRTGFGGVHCRLQGFVARTCG